MEVELAAGRSRLDRAANIYSRMKIGGLASASLLPPARLLCAHALGIELLGMTVGAANSPRRGSGIGFFVFQWH
jgi:hypothetical protein